MTTNDALAVPEDLLSILVDLARKQSKPAVGFKRSINGGDNFPSILDLFNEKLETELNSDELDSLIDELVLNRRLIKSRGQTGGYLLELTELGFRSQQDHATPDLITPENILSMFKNIIESTGKSAALNTQSMNSRFLRNLEEKFNLRSDTPTLHKAAKICTGNGWIKKKHRSGHALENLIITEAGLAHLPSASRPIDRYSGGPVVSDDWASFVDAINNNINRSSFDHKIQSVIKIDLEEATKCYNGGAYKACIVMLGACLEGFMSGYIQRDDVIRLIQSDASRFSNLLTSLRCGIADPNFAKKLRKASFDDMRKVTNELIPDIQSHGVENIQSYRNSIHPNVSRERDDFGLADRSIAMNYLTGLVTMSKKIVEYEP